MWHIAVALCESLVGKQKQVILSYYCMKNIGIIGPGKNKTRHTYFGHSLDHTSLICLIFNLSRRTLILGKPEKSQPFQLLNITL